MGPWMGRRRLLLKVAKACIVYAIAAGGATGVISFLSSSNVWPATAPLDTVPRRMLIVTTSASMLGSLAGQQPAVAEDLKRRLSEKILDKLPSGFIAPWGPRDLYYPTWMQGNWHVQAVQTDYLAPMGLQYVGNSGSTPGMAVQTLKEQQSRLGEKSEYDLAYMLSKSKHVLEDRKFNSAARINAYAGRKVVKRVEYADVPGNTREDALKNGDGPEDPLLTTLVYFKGGAQKVFVLGFQSEEQDSGNVWRGSQSVRTLFAAPGTGANPLVVDEEVLTELRRQPNGSVDARVRLIGYLNPNDPLFFQAGNKAVTIADYSLQFSRLAESTNATAAS
eukprot:CAMPEP_0172678288 /NCGR_PEP_ID=MMETSP1074-20121228/15294_1 /TAXON_ID=2916 /ORGANISM="Ceratium fusus, Strain PA161109" /LENGTH=333 /DNA_ID=CAMNT_0013496299 /DNA_START=24 /DNA_END=1025 /DNA_ORIENTATION=-